MIIDGIAVICPADMTEEEAAVYVRSEIEHWKQTKPGKEIGSIIITIEGDEVVITAKERSPIRRIRRITGYLSSEDRFNDAKLAELRDRVKHL